MKHLFRINNKLVSGIILLISVAVNAQPITQSEVDSYLKGLPFEMNKLNIPSFPQKYFEITKYGALGDGLTINTNSIQKAIDDCSGSGGGYVVIPSGLWLTGALKIKSNVNLHLEKGAMIVFSANHDDFPVIKVSGKSGYVCANPILAEGAENIAITGEGIINGNGQTWRPVKKSKMTESEWKSLIKSGGALNDKKDIWWPSAEAAGAEEFLKGKSVKDLRIEDIQKVKDFYRPHLIYFVNCKNVLLDGPTFQNSPNFAVYITKSENIITHNVKVNNEWYAQNGDGLDYSACKNVLICKCTVNAGDDGICMKSSRSNKQGSEPALQNIVVADCVVYHGHGGFVIGSNTDGGMKNIFVNNCSFSWTDTGLRFKSGRGNGGLVENIFISNIFMKDIKEQAIIFDMYYEDKAVGKSKEQTVQDKMPLFQKISIDRLICDGCGQAVFINGISETAVKDIEIKNSVIVANNGFEALEAEGIRLDNVDIRCSEATVISINNSRNISLNKIGFEQKAKQFIKLSGEKTYNINLSNTKLDTIEKAVEIGEGVNSKALKIN